MKKLVASILLLVSVPSLVLAADVRDDLQTKMKYLSNRQSVISQNIANANTPKYKSNDIKPVEFGSSGKIQLTTTAPGHLGGTGAANGNFKTIRDKDTYDSAPNGNNVVIEEQMIKMADTDMDYQATTSIMKQMNGLLRVAVGNR